MRSRPPVGTERLAMGTCVGARPGLDTRLVPHNDSRGADGLKFLSAIGRCVHIHAGVAGGED